jgi:hypothetical protein
VLSQQGVGGALDIRLPYVSHSNLSLNF